MKNIFLIITVIMFVQKMENNKPSDKIYKCISSDNIEEFIKISHNTKSSYFGAEKIFNQGYLYFTADIIIEKRDNDSIRFHLSNYKYSKTPVTPYKETKYFVPDGKKLALFNGGTVYFGKIERDKLVLNKQKQFSDSATEIIIFTEHK